MSGKAFTYWVSTWRVTTLTVVLLSGVACNAEEKRMSGDGSLVDPAKVLAAEELLRNGMKGAVPDKGSYINASKVLDLHYAMMVDGCIEILRSNRGKKATEMQPNYEAVKTSIRQLGNLAGYCHRNRRETGAVEAILPFLMEEFRPVEKTEDGIEWVPLQGALRPSSDYYDDRGQTEAARALPAFGEAAARAVIALIVLGGGWQRSRYFQEE